MKGLIILMLLAGIACAQTDEIKSQFVHMGGYVQQYAKVDIVELQGSYQIPCPDCTAYANISLDGMHIADENMSEIMPGLFGFKADPAVYSFGNSYFMRVTTTSPTYGTGFTDSFFMVVQENRTISQATETSGSGGGIFDLSTLSDILKGVVDYVSSPIIVFLERSGIKAIVDFIIESKLVALLIDTLKWSLSVIFAILSVTKDFILDPKATLMEEIWPWLVNGGLWIGSLFFIWFMMAEAVIIGFSMRKKDTFDTLSEWFRLHLKMFGYIGVIGSFVFEKTAKVIELGIRLVQAVLTPVP